MKSSQSILLKEEIELKLKALNFDSVAPIDWAWIDIESTLQSEVFLKHVDYYKNWLQKGYHGTMGYLDRGFEKRLNPRQLLSDAEAILCFAIPYERRPVGNLNSQRGPRWARYIGNGSRQDYHSAIVETMEPMLQAIKSRVPEFNYKITVDSSAVLERTWAALSGLGWIGKNKCFIHPTEGSYVFLAEVLVNFKTDFIARPLKNLCGNCTRCLTVCPTQAFDSEGKLNANRCISYLTLEFRGKAEAIDLDLSSKFENWIAGCDLCQEVCPFNFKAVKRDSLSNLKPTVDAAWPLDWSTWTEEGPEVYKKRVAQTAMSRVKPAQMQRNLELAIKNSKNSK